MQAMWFRRAMGTYSDLRQAPRVACRGADVLVSEIYTFDDLDNAPWGGLSAEEKEHIIWAYHFSPRELAASAGEAGVGLLVLTCDSNYSSPYEPLALELEIKRHYPGDEISSRDVDVF